MTTVRMNSPFDRVYSRNVGYGCRCTGLGRALRLKRHQGCESTVPELLPYTASIATGVSYLFSSSLPPSIDSRGVSSAGSP